MMDMSHKEERRLGYAEITPEFFDSISNHMALEEQKFREGSDRMERIEADLQPIKKMYWAISGSALVGAVLLALLIYVYVSDKGDYREGFKVLQQAIIVQGEAVKVQGEGIKELMVSQKNLEASYHRDVERIERGQDRLLNQSGRKVTKGERND